MSLLRSGADYINPLEALQHASPHFARRTSHVALGIIRFLEGK
jgi:hypothetical protein